MRRIRSRMVVLGVVIIGVVILGISSIYAFYDPYDSPTDKMPPSYGAPKVEGSWGWWEGHEDDIPWMIDYLQGLIDEDKLDESAIALTELAQYEIGLAGQVVEGMESGTSASILAQMYVVGSTTEAANILAQVSADGEVELAAKILNDIHHWLDNPALGPAAWAWISIELIDTNLAEAVKIFSVALEKYREGTFITYIAEAIAVMEPEEAARILTQDGVSPEFAANILNSCYEYIGYLQYGRIMSDEEIASILLCMRKEQADAILYAEVWYTGRTVFSDETIASILIWMDTGEETPVVESPAGPEDLSTESELPEVVHSSDETPRLLGGFWWEDMEIDEIVAKLLTFGEFEQAETLAEIINSDLIKGAKVLEGVFTETDFGRRHKLAVYTMDYCNELNPELINQLLGAKETTYLLSANTAAYFVGWYGDIDNAAELLKGLSSDRIADILVNVGGQGTGMTGVGRMNEIAYIIWVESVFSDLGELGGQVLVKILTDDSSYSINIDRWVEIATEKFCSKEVKDAILNLLILTYEASIPMYPDLGNKAAQAYFKITGEPIPSPKELTILPTVEGPTEPKDLPMEPETPIKSSEEPEVEIIGPVDLPIPAEPIKSREDVIEDLIDVAQRYFDDEMSKSETKREMIDIIQSYFDQPAMPPEDIKTKEATKEAMIDSIQRYFDDDEISKTELMTELVDIAQSYFDLIIQFK